MSWLKPVAVGLGVALCVVMIGVLIGLWASWMSSRDTSEFRKVCDELHAKYVNVDGRKCIKDDKIVYP